MLKLLNTNEVSGSICNLVRHCSIVDQCDTLFLPIDIQKAAGTPHSEAAHHRASSAAVLRSALVGLHVAHLDAAIGSGAPPRARACGTVRPTAYPWAGCSLRLHPRWLGQDQAQPLVAAPQASPPLVPGSHASSRDGALIPSPLLAGVKRDQRPLALTSNRNSVALKYNQRI